MSIITSTLMVRLPPSEVMQQGQREYSKEQRNLAPVPEPGDKYTISGALLGIIIGTILGVRTGMPGWILAGILGGGIAGSLIGTLVGKTLAQYRNSRNRPS